MTDTLPPLIGLTGRAGVGKDTVAAALAAHHGYGRVAFADALKRAAYETNPLVYVGGYSHARLADLVDAHGWDVAKRAVPDVRAYLQRFGVAMRNVLPGVWVRLAAERIDELRAAGHPVAVTDVRFPDEVEAIRGRGGLVVRIERPSVAPLPSGLDGHASESGADALDVDVTVANDSTLAAIVGRAHLLHDLAAMRGATV